MKILNTKTSVNQVGNAPVDLLYTVEQEVLTNDKIKVYIQVQLEPTGETKFAVSTGSLFGKKSEIRILEMYDSLEESVDSNFYGNFTTVNQMLNENVKETLSEIDDSKFYNGPRIGASFSNEGFVKYAEEAVYIRDYSKHLYLQVKIKGNQVIYSITDRSIFMRMEMRNMYKMYFGETPEAKVLLETDNINELGVFSSTKQDFIRVKTLLEEKFNKLRKAD